MLKKSLLKINLLIIAIISVIIINIIIINNNLYISRIRNEEYINTLTLLSDIKAELSSLIGWQTILVQSKEKQTVYMARRKSSEHLQELEELQENLLDSSLKELYNKNIELINSFLISLLNNIKDLEPKDETFELQIRSKSQLIKQQIVKFELLLVNNSTNKNESMFNQVVRYISIELLFFMLISILLMISVNRREKAEESINRIKHYLDNVIDSMPSQLIAIDKDFKVILWNRAAQTVTGVDSNIAQGKLLLDIYPEMDKEKENLTTCLLSREIFQKSNVELLNDKEKKYVNITIYPLVVNSVDGVVIIIEDITLKVELQKRVKESDERYKSIIESSYDWIWEIDKRGYFSYSSPHIESILGYKPEEIIGISPFALLSEKNDKAVDKKLASLLKNEEPILSIVNINRSKSGKDVILETNGVPFYNSDGEYAGYRGIDRDITARKIIENKLRESEDKYRRLIENIGEEYFFYTHDINGIFNYVSSSVTKMLGYSQKEFIGHYTQYMTNSDINVQAKINTENSIKGIKQPPYIIEVNNKLGNIRLLEVTEVPITNEFDEVVAVEGIAHDITEKKMAEMELTSYKDELEKLVSERTLELRESLEKLRSTQKQLVESEKMASLGGLIAGVAHDINTPLGIIVTAASHIEEEIEHLNKKFRDQSLSQSGLKKFCNQSLETAQLILRNSQAASKLIGNFKQIAVDQTWEELIEFNLEEFIAEIVSSFSYKLKTYEVEVNINCPQKLIIKNYPKIFNQIISNLMHNSLLHGFHNMQGGTIDIEMARDGDYINMSYRDSGIGMSKENLDNIFEPFFTTKRGRGRSGLGMFIIYNLVTQTLKGSIVCNSKAGEGLSVKITFPSIAV